jgi:hypothetical protein
MPGGFGSDTRHDNALGADAGFGSPGGLLSTQDYGFGSGSRFRDPVLQIMPYSFQYPLYPDEGGVLVRIMGQFPIRGPWRVRITSDAGATLHPVGKVGCYSGVIGQGYLCHTNFYRNALVFVLPPVPVGLYDVWVEEVTPAAMAIGPTRIIVGGLSVVVRNPCEQTYGYRQMFPPRYDGTGVRAWELEDGSLPTHPTAPLATLSRAAGQVLQQSGGTPQTRLSAAVAPDATVINVQSTLGFPDDGEIWVRERRYSYTSKSASLFSGCTLLTADDRRTIPVLTEVTCHAPALQPV